MEAGQGDAFLILFSTGMVLGFCFDLYRLVRKRIRLRKVATALGDFFYWLVATGVIFYSMIWSNWGEWRFYVFFSLLGGWVVYYRVISQLVIQFVWNALRKK